ncbi:hypothetical protein BDQ12DRAFT_520509 [Crucibulum laeve]|uniref:Uncharacterized protein n=1 Tax=Crucibulum laeve TaxID=68775 RepID=A0A5C3M6J6_9AGAR|nr:hypothetical protein BDQ12DRAFT_520509 [Crucibulum laeve]
MAFSIPFGLSYIILTPRRVRLPGETTPQTSPKKTTSSRSPLRWSTGIATRAKSLRSRRTSNVPVPPIQQSIDAPPAASTVDAEHADTDMLIDDGAPRAI